MKDIGKSFKISCFISLNSSRNTIKRLEVHLFSIFFILMLIFLFLFQISINAGENILFSIQVEPLTIHVDEVFQLIISIESSNRINIDKLPDFSQYKSLQLVQPPIINGFVESNIINYQIKTRYIKRVIFNLKANEPNIISELSLSMVVNGKTHVLKSFSLPIYDKKIEEEQTKLETFFINNINPEEVYPGQPAICEWIIYSKKDLTDIQILKQPDIYGCTFQKINSSIEKELISLFNEQIYKYTIYKALIFPIDINDAKYGQLYVSFYFEENHEIKEVKYLYPAKKLKVKKLPDFDSSFFGLIGNYRIDYSYKRIEEENSIYYQMEIIFSGTGNHQYLDFNKLKFVQQNWNIFGPLIYKDDSVAKLTYLLYPNKYGALIFNQVDISILNLETDSMEKFVIPPSMVIINQDIEQALKAYQFIPSAINVSYKFIDDKRDYLSIIPISWLILYSFIALTLSFSLWLIHLIVVKISNTKRKSLSFENLWLKLSSKYDFSDEKNFNKFLENLNKKEKQLILTAQFIYQNLFSENVNKKMTTQKIKHLNKNLKRFIKIKKIKL